VSRPSPLGWVGWEGTGFSPYVNLPRKQLGLQPRKLLRYPAPVHVVFPGISPYSKNADAFVRLGSPWVRRLAER
jgi:hypothetical protein